MCAGNLNADYSAIAARPCCGFRFPVIHPDSFVVPFDAQMAMVSRLFPAEHFSEVMNQGTLLLRGCWLRWPPAHWQGGISVERIHPRRGKYRDGLPAHRAFSRFQSDCRIHLIWLCGVQVGLFQTPNNSTHSSASRSVRWEAWDAGVGPQFVGTDHRITLVACFSAFTIALCTALLHGGERFAVVATSSVA